MGISQQIIDAHVAAIMDGGTVGYHEVDGYLDGSSVVLNFDSEEIVEGDQVTGFRAILVHVYLKTSDGEVCMSEWLKDDVFESLQEQLEEILEREEF